MDLKRISKQACDYFERILEQDKWGTKPNYFPVVVLHRVEFTAYIVVGHII